MATAQLPIKGVFDSNNGAWQGIVAPDGKELPLVRAFKNKIGSFTAVRQFQGTAADQDLRCVMRIPISTPSRRPQIGETLRFHILWRYVGADVAAQKTMVLSIDNLAVENQFYTPSIQSQSATGERDENIAIRFKDSLVDPLFPQQQIGSGGVAGQPLTFKKDFNENTELLISFKSSANLGTTHNCQILAASVYWE